MLMLMVEMLVFLVTRRACLGHREDGRLERFGAERVEELLEFLAGQVLAGVLEGVVCAEPEVSTRDVAF